MPTALITGASTGIGAAFARQLAAEGYDLVLVARDKTRLDEVAEVLHNDHGVETEVLAADLVTDSGCGVVELRLAEGPPVDLLINNAGIGNGGTFWRGPVEDEDRLLRLNVRAVMRLTHAALGPMVARGRGDIINVSSMAAYLTGGTATSYSASKAWVSNFTASLALRLQRTGVRICALCPGFTRTPMIHNGRGMPGWWLLDPDDVARTGLRDLRRGRTVSVPGRQYKLARALVHVVPERVVRAAARRR